MAGAGSVLQVLRDLIPFGSEVLSAGATPVMLTVPDKTHATRVVFRNGPGNFTLDGTTPDATQYPAFDAQEEVLNHAESVKAKFLRNGGINLDVIATYYMHRGA